MGTAASERHGTATPARPAKPGDLFSPISLNRISTVIVDQIRQLIHSGEIQEGARLPTERELCEQFGVSRVTVREALRVLEVAGLVEIRVGSRGGAFVTAPTGERVSAGLTDLIALSGFTATDVTEARQLIDIGVAPLVCQRATDEDIDELSALCTAAEKAFKAGTYTLEMSAEFHIQMARATHNRAIAVLVQSFREPILMSLARAREAAPLMGKRGIAEHRAIVDAVRDRDSDRAVKIMAEHLSRTLKRVSEATASVHS